MHHTIFGESHGPAVGVVLTDVPPGLALDLGFIQSELARRATGKNKLSTARKEPDTLQILSGVFQGVTTGTPLCMVIENADQHSADYEDLKNLARPGHGDFAGFLRYHGFNDYRGGGHFSGRLTAPLVAAGAVAKLILREKGVRVAAHIASIEGIRDDCPDFARPDMDALLALSTRDFPVLKASASDAMQEAILSAREEQDSVGGSIRCFLTGIPGGLGAPDFDENAETIFARQLFAVPAVKGLGFGIGFGFAAARGSEANDPFCIRSGEIATETNQNGGINGGITNGMPIVFEVAIKPTPSIAKEQKTVNFRTRAETVIRIRGRHDPCIVHRAVPVIEAAAALAACQLMRI